jgi:hypothetical protein
VGGFKSIIGIFANKEHRSRDGVARDLDQLFALSRLFDAAYLTNRIESDSATVFHALGLVARQGETVGASSLKPWTGRAATKPPPYNHGEPVPWFADPMGLSSKFNVKRSEFLR